MEKFKLTNAEVLSLQKDLAFFLEQDTKPRARYLLIELAKKAQDLISSFNKVNEELVKKYGSELDNGQIGIMQFTDDTKTAFTEAFTSYVKDLEPLMLEEHEIEVKPIPEDLIAHIENKASDAFFKFVKWD